MGTRMPPEEAGMEEGGAPEGGGPGEVAQSIASGFAQLNEMLAQSGAPPEAAQELAALAEGFNAFVAKLGGGPEQAPAEGASPVNQPEGRPVGPAGV
jgi:hypothetical protein